MNYKCNECKETFTEKDVTLNTEKLGHGIEQIYYNCPKCGHRYNVCKTNAQTRKLQTEIKEQTVLIKNRLSKGLNIVNDINKLNKIIQKHKRAMNKLNDK